MQPIPQVETERLVLRELGESDSQAVLNLFCSQEMVRYLDMEPMQDCDQAREMVAWGQSLWERGEGLLLGLCDRQTDQLLGTLHYLKIAEHRAQVFFDLHPTHWGQGLTPEALRGSLSYPFELLHVLRVESTVPVTSMRSARVLLKSGFVMEGVLRDYGCTHGELHDVMMFSLLREEWLHPEGVPAPLDL